MKRPFIVKSSSSVALSQGRIKTISSSWDTCTWVYNHLFDGHQSPRDSPKTSSFLLTWAFSGWSIWKLWDKLNVEKTIVEFGVLRSNFKARVKIIFRVRSPLRYFDFFLCEYMCVCHETGQRNNWKTIQDIERMNYGVIATQGPVLQCYTHFLLDYR